jgi:hypothetical protein
MPRITLTQIQSLPDLLSSEHFTFNLGEIPNVGDGLQLMLKCVDCNIPGFSTEAFDVMLHGVQRSFRGRKMYPRTLACTYVEDSTMDTLNTLRSWMEQVVGTDSNTSVGGILDYSVPATLTIFDQAGNDIDSMDFINCYVQDVPDVQVTGESSTLMRVTATFKYDYIQYRGVNIR